MNSIKHTDKNDTTPKKTNANVNGENCLRYSINLFNLFVLVSFYCNIRI